LYNLIHVPSNLRNFGTYNKTTHFIELFLWCGTFVDALHKKSIVDCAMCVVLGNNIRGGMKE